MGRRGEDEEMVAVMEGQETEGLLPRMPLSVLLVEGDHSTRQIIAALLRKCSYKVVAASDGVKAWETLKDNSDNIDLVLTEVELPLMSGFILLSMIAESETCKNIPVIMMSSRDSFSTVFKCMLKGAADFLVKPIRTNELRNLWQHVWRRRITSDGLDVRPLHQNGNRAKSDPKARPENGEFIFKGIAQKKELSEQESDVQSSCTRSDMEVESKHKQNVLVNKPPTSRVLSEVDNQIVQTCEGDIQLGSSTQIHEPESEDRNEDLTAIGQLASEADLIGVINNKLECNTMLMDLDSVPKITQKNRTSRAEPHFEMSLKRFNFGDSDKQINNQRPTLNHSISSAFSLYNNRMAAVSSIAGYTPSCSNSTPDVDLDVEHTKLTDHSFLAEDGKTVHCTPVRVIPFPIPVGGISFDKQASWQGPHMQPFLCSHSTHPLWSNSASMWPGATMQTDSSHQTVPNSLNSTLVENTDNQSVKRPSRYTEQEQEDTTKGPLDEQMRASSVVSESRSISACNGSRIPLSGSGCGSASPAAVVAKINNDAAHSLSQREAALNKFRLKRKERCFEKKVRYQSRKILAEQRPRVKGQFVHQDRPILRANGEVYSFTG